MPYIAILNRFLPFLASVPQRIKFVDRTIVENISQDQLSAKEKLEREARVEGKE